MRDRQSQCCFQVASFWFYFEETDNFQGLYSNYGSPSCTRNVQKITPVNNISFKNATLFYAITWFFSGDPIGGMLNYPSICRSFSSFCDNESSVGWFAFSSVLYVDPVAALVVGNASTVVFYECSAGMYGFSCVCKIIVSKSIFVLEIPVYRASPSLASIWVQHEHSPCLCVVLHAAIGCWSRTEVDLWCSVVGFWAGKTLVLLDFRIWDRRENMNW